MFLHGTSKVTNNGQLEIAGVNTIELAEKYGTPLYIYDVELIRQRARGFKQTFEKLGVNAQVAYASKAFSSIAMFQLANAEGLSLDVVSGGEMYTALAAGFPASRIHFHGNNKSYEELNMALEHKLGCIVVDNFHELQLLQQVAANHQQNVQILLRLTPGVEAHTHDYITTGQEDSKFGFDLHNGQIETAIEQALSFENIELLGFHCHIGSQIFETAGFVLAAETVFEKIKDWKEAFKYSPSVVNLGGGFGIRYTAEDQPLSPSIYVEEIVKAVRSKVEELNMTMPEIWIEPGRSLVGDAGTTIYEVGSQKNVPNVRNYLAVDGGMSDNIRPALYQAKYEAVLANKMNEQNSETYSIAGKACESGDMLIWDLELPKASAGDYLAVFCTGAYGYSMASNYNRLSRPAVVFVENGEDQLVIKRETFEDLIKNDLPLKSKVIQG